VVNMYDGIVRSLSGRISTHRSSWMANLHTHRCTSQLSVLLGLYFVLSLMCFACFGRPHSKFCVAVSGFKVAGSLSAAVFSQGYATPTLHVLGKNDVLVVEERSRVLINVSLGKRVEEHDGGTRKTGPSPQGTHVSPTPFLKDISFRPGHPGGHSLKHTCSIRQAIFQALAHTQCHNPGRVR
jgi:Serine hydrolase (FSH1)